MYVNSVHFGLSGYNLYQLSGFRQQAEYNFPLNLLKFTQEKGLRPVGVEPTCPVKDHGFLVRCVYQFRHERKKRVNPHLRVFLSVPTKTLRAISNYTQCAGRGQLFFEPVISC